MLPFFLFTILTEDLAPIDEIKEYITFFYRCRLNDKDIAKEMEDHYDQEKYGLRYAIHLPVMSN